MPAVSIIVPVYNKSEYLSHTIQSILTQSYNDYEVIIINDGSTDNSLEIALKHQQKDIRIKVYDIPNGGVSNARNLGLEKASGKWIQFLDADDLIDDTYLENAVNIAEFNNVDILFSGFCMTDENKNVIKRTECMYNGTATQHQLGDLFIEYQYKNGFFGFTSNKLIRKKLIEKSGARFKTNLKLAEDLDFYALLYSHVKSAYFSDINSFYYIQTATNYQNNQKIDYYSQITVHLDIKNWFIKNGQYDIYKNILDKKVAEYVYYSLFYAREYSEDISTIFQRIANNIDIISCINLDEFSGFQKSVLSAVKTDNCFKVKLLMNGRYLIREIYRRIKK